MKKIKSINSLGVICLLAVFQVTFVACSPFKSMDASGIEDNNKVTQVTGPNKEDSPYDDGANDYSAQSVDSVDSAADLSIDPGELSASPLLIDISVSAEESEQPVPDNINDARQALANDQQQLNEDENAPPSSIEPQWLTPPEDLEQDFQFWVQVYTKVTTRQGFIHDDRNLAVIYEAVDLPKSGNRRSLARFIKKRKQYYINILKSLSQGKTKNLTDDEQRVAQLWAGASRTALRQAMSRLRFQLGQSDRFLEGYVRSGTWEPYIRQIFASQGLPTDLVLLPHVESSFNPKAYSKVGAAGMWQFTRSTGRLFMRVDHVIDERMDPYLSTIAAAKLLKSNYRQLQSWPLTLTSYNHGVAGMKRAIRKTGGIDIVKINKTYQSRIFGFASRNFYLSFLAARHVHNHAKQYFGAIEKDKPLNYDRVEAPAYLAMDTLSRVLGVKKSVLSQYNPAFREPIINGSKYIPKGYELRLPAELTAVPMVEALGAIEPSECFIGQQPDLSYRVRRGDTLSGIAKKFNVRVQDLVLMNGLRSRNRIRIGQKLVLPKPLNAQVMMVAVSAQSAKFDLGCKVI